MIKKCHTHYSLHHVPSSKYPSKILVGRFQQIRQNWRKKEEVTTVETHIPIKASCKTLVAQCRNWSVWSCDQWEVYLIISTWVGFDKLGIIFRLLPILALFHHMDVSNPQWVIPANAMFIHVKISSKCQNKKISSQVLRISPYLWILVNTNRIEGCLNNEDIGQNKRQSTRGNWWAVDAPKINCQKERTLIFGNPGSSHHKSRAKYKRTIHIENSLLH